MKRFVSILLLLSCPAILKAQIYCPVIPAPASAKKLKGKFSLDKATAIVYSDSTLHTSALYLQQGLSKILQTSMLIQAGKTEKGNIIKLEKRGARVPASTYSLKINDQILTIGAPDEEGVFNGVNTLLQLAGAAETGKQKVTIDRWHIHDTARFGWRGLMLDESRHFFGKETVKMILDRMAFYKLNRFHWHLTDAPGWRLEIKQYPLLTTIGAVGNHTDPAAPAKYYTQKDIKEIVRYAADRNIIIIPEIDMPGHATAANRAYPEFSGGGNARYPDFTFNPGVEKTYAYLTNIIRETSGLFPSGLIHLGGDEVSFSIESWNKDQNILDLMKKENLDNLKEVEAYFIKRMADSARKMYRRVGMWDEAADVVLPADSSIIFWWRHDKPEQLNKSIDKGYQVVLCPRLPFYFDFVQDSSHSQGRKWRDNGFSSLEKVYNFPVGQAYHIDDNHQLVIGLQANLWTETVKTRERLEYLLFPRIAALSEAGWSSPAQKNYPSFLSKIKKHLDEYRRQGIKFYNPGEPENTPEIVDPE